MCLRDPQSPGIGQGEAEQIIGLRPLLDLSPSQQSQRDPGATNQYPTHVTEAPIDRQLFLGADAQGLVPLAETLVDSRRFQQ